MYSKTMSRLFYEFGKIVFIVFCLCSAVFLFAIFLTKFLIH